MPPLNPERVACTIPLARQERLRRFIAEKRGGGGEKVRTPGLSLVINEALEAFLKAEGY